MSQPQPPRTVSGNATSTPYRGWISGRFVDPLTGGPLAGDVEIKWGRASAGQARAEWTTDTRHASACLLVSGAIRLETTEGAVTLTSPGDYLAWGPGVEHAWTVLADDTVTVTVRWPS